MVRRVLLAASSSDRVESLVRSARMTRELMGRYVAGDAAEDAASAAAALAAANVPVTLDHLGEEVHAPGHAVRAVEAHLAVLDALVRRGVAKGADITVRLPAMGLHLGEKVARENAARVCRAADDAGATVTLDMERPAHSEAALALHAGLRTEHPATGVVIPSSLRQAVEHCRSLASARVRLSRGPAGDDDPAAYADAGDVDRSYVRCLKVLMAGQGHPTVATHDRRLIEVAAALAVLNEREPDGFEYLVAYGVRTPAQRRLAGPAARVRVRVPFGPGWYGHLVRDLAERPSHLPLLTRSLIGRRA
ncbi:proline dehydrogenase [Sphaerisporangium sp. TRM90804]|uniref:proline dehydrogenase n=1 Tax=Sphaerisporangium sp. TRM90804 TaxID=3031113 RepID=UPI00244C28F0|nr:proline dehydrogenase [Sphaerisporangium sp. TRM90804]MDH2426768.1 proline dehydrogenase [Sphaerisporangium sp. TRM90804]